MLSFHKGQASKSCGSCPDSSHPSAWPLAKRNEGSQRPPPARGIFASPTPSSMAPADLRRRPCKPEHGLGRCDLRKPRWAEERPAGRGGRRGGGRCSGSRRTRRCRTLALRPGGRCLASVAPCSREDLAALRVRRVPGAEFGACPFGAPRNEFGAGGSPWVFALRSHGFHRIVISRSMLKHETGQISVRRISLRNMHHRTSI